MKKMTFGEMLKKRRLELNLTTYDVADALEVSNAYISKIENGKRYPSKRVLYLLIIHLNFYQFKKKENDNLALEIIKNNVNYGNLLEVYAEERNDESDLSKELEEVATLKSLRFKKSFDRKKQAVYENRIIQKRDASAFEEIERPYFDLEWLLNQTEYEIFYGNEYDVSNSLSVQKENQLTNDTNTFNKLSKEDIKLIREVIETIISNKYKKFPLSANKRTIQG